MRGFLRNFSVIGGSKNEVFEAIISNSRFCTIPKNPQTLVMYNYIKYWIKKKKVYSYTRNSPYSVTGCLILMKY